MGRKIRSIWESNPVGCGALYKLRGKIIETSMYLHEETKNRIVRSKQREVSSRSEIKKIDRGCPKNASGKSQV